MTIGFCRIAAAALAVSATATAAAYADPTAGARLAQRWCISCHVTSANATGTVPQGPPSFPAIARNGMTREQLRIFLSKPHGKMPDLTLSRAEIDDLIDYIESLR